MFRKILSPVPLFQKSPEARQCYSVLYTRTLHYADVLGRSLLRRLHPSYIMSETADSSSGHSHPHSTKFDLSARDESSPKTIDIPQCSTHVSASDQDMKDSHVSSNKNGSGDSRCNQGDGVSSTCKRPADGDSDNVLIVKKAKADSPTTQVSTSETAEKVTSSRPDRVVRKKMAVLMVYSGTGYFGMQRNPPHPTIEEDLLSGLHKIGVITDEHYDTPQKMHFQRAARTDKGVSALGQVVSLQLPVNADGLIQKVNELLPDQIRVLGMKRCTKGFNSKNHCMSRTYSYVIPTFTFAPLEEKTTEEFRASEKVLADVNSILSMYKGTHNFHNFTSGKKPSDPSAVRYIMEFGCGPVYVKDGIEFTVIKVKGQSFMLHQIRKMIGLMIAVVRGLASKQAIQQAWQPEKFDVPIAPALGLMLEQLHYDGYNKRFGTDGIHDPITWDEHKDEIEAFKHKFVYPNIVQKEKQEKSMMTWLSTLLNHTFDTVVDVTGGRRLTPMQQAFKNVDSINKQEPSHSSDKAQHVTESTLQTEDITGQSEQTNASTSPAETEKQLTEQELNTQSKTDTDQISGSESEAVIEQSRSHGQT